MNESIYLLWSLTDLDSLLIGMEGLASVPDLPISEEPVFSIRVRYCWLRHLGVQHLSLRELLLQTIFSYVAARFFFYFFPHPAGRLDKCNVAAKYLWSNVLWFTELRSALRA